jgi:hypothetical protein
MGNKTALCSFFFSFAYPPISVHERLSIVVSKLACWEGDECSMAYSTSCHRIKVLLGK